MKFLSGVFFLTMVLVFSGMAEEAHAQSGTDPCKVNFINGALVYECDYGGGTTALIRYQNNQKLSQDGRIVYDVDSVFTLAGMTNGNYDLTIGTNGSSVRYTGAIQIEGNPFVVDCTINTETGDFAGSNCGGIGLIANPQAGADAVNDLDDLNPQQAASVFVLSVLLPDLNNLQEVIKLERTTRKKILRNQVRNVRRSLQMRFRSVSRYLFLKNRANRTRTIRQAKAEGSPFVALGKNAGDEDGVSIGLWTDFSYSDVETSSIGEETEGDTVTGLMGLDSPVTDELVLGMYGGYLEADTDLSFLGGKQVSDGFLVGAYAAYLLDRQTSLDVSLSYGEQETDLTFPQAGIPVTGQYDSDRISGAVNLTRYEETENWLLTGVVGYSHTQEKAEAYVLTDGSAQTSDTIDLGLASVSGEAAYLGFENLSPYVAMGIEYELSEAEDVERTTFIPSIGVRYSFMNNLEGGMVVSKQYMQADEDVTSISANLRLSF